MELLIQLRRALVPADLPPLVYVYVQRAMGLLFADMKLALEPAGAAATAALCGPLRERLAGKRVGVIVCGSNIDLATFAKQAIPYEPRAK